MPRLPHQTANLLTLTRVVLVPVFVVEYLVRAPVLTGALAIFLLAALTDWLDGWVARRFAQQSAFGAFLDPVADKLMVVAALMLVVRSHPTLLTLLSAMLVILREVYVSALREWMASAGLRNVVAVAQIGKWKTATQMLALVVLMWGLNQMAQDAADGATAMRVGEGLLVVAALLSVISCVQYSLGAYRGRPNRNSDPGPA
mgnify:FL=1